MRGHDPTRHDHLGTGMIKFDMQLIAFDADNLAIAEFLVEHPLADRMGADGLQVDHRIARLARLADRALRAKIGIEDEAFFIAAGDTFQIWKPETYETEELARAEAWLDELPEDFDPLIYLDNAKGD